MNLDDLKKPFPADAIEWRVQQAGAKGDKPWAMVLAYITSRAVMDRLDDVCGIGKWKNEFKAGPEGGVLCGISVKIDDEWVTKWDGAENTQIEPVKGGLSGAEKRAGAQWGIGRYLYELPATFAVIAPNGANFQPAKQSKYGAFKWNPPQLPAWALPEGDKTPKNKVEQEQPKDDPRLTEENATENVATEEQLIHIQEMFDANSEKWPDEARVWIADFLKKDDSTKKTAEIVIAKIKGLPK